MWVKNISRVSRPMFKDEKIVVIQPGAVADVDIPKTVVLKKIGLEPVDLKTTKDVVVGQPATIAIGKSATKNKKERKK